MNRTPMVFGFLAEVKLPKGCPSMFTSVAALPAPPRCALTLRSRQMTESYGTLRNFLSIQFNNYLPKTYYASETRFQEYGYS